MRCIECDAAEVSERPEPTAGAVTGASGAVFVESSFNVAHCACLNFQPHSIHPSGNVIALVVFWRLRYRLSLRDLPEMFLIRGIEFSYEAVRD